jgi:UDP-2-acetamido-3-amino-2,3-dideoxy-glucuronate N-acetyltransferase
VKHGATLGANSTIVCGVIIGQYAFVGAGALINKDIPDYALVVGVPCRQIGWMSEFGERLDLNLGENGSVICKSTGDVYSVLNGVCEKK